MTIESTPGVQLLREGDVSYQDISPGIAGARSITAAGFTRLGGGWVRMDGSGELAGWTLRYDEVLYCVDGRLEVETDGSRVVALPVVLHPRDWAERPPL
jgi:ethanolamine utilization protein EutQ (cupin superfamily)